MRKRILVTGKNGQLGCSLKRAVTLASLVDFTFVGRAELDFEKPKQVLRYFDVYHYDYIINVAAYTAVDKAETEQQQAEQINHYAVAQLANIAKERNTALIQISTDYVFGGTYYRPYGESDPSNPQGIYGATKQRGEQAMLDIAPQGCIVRTSWLYSEFGNNFVKTMLRLAKERKQIRVVFDQVGSPTYAPDLAKALLSIVDSGKLEEKCATPAIYHYANEGVCSWYDLAIATFELAQQTSSVSPIESSEYPTPAKRPYYSVLNNRAIKKKFGIEIPYWRYSLKQCIGALTAQTDHPK
jgi:dTDP-4-dehydrorhamnose reductase